MFKRSLFLSLFFLMASPVFAFWPFANSVIQEGQYLNQYAQPSFVNKILNLKKLVENHTSIITDYEKEELSWGQMLKILDRTKTSLGPWGLQQLEPVGDLKEIQRRQSVIKEFIKVHSQCGFLLNEIAQMEGTIYSYWDSKNLFHLEANKLYFNLFSRSLNRNRLALEGSFFVDHVETFLSLLAKVGAFTLGQEINNAFSHGKKLELKSILSRMLQKPIKDHTISPEVFEHGYDEQKLYEFWNSGTAGDYYIYMKNYGAGNTGIPSRAVKGGAALLTLGNTGFNDFVWGRSLYSSGEHLSFLYDALNKLQKQMVVVSKFFKTIKELDTLIHSNSILYNTDIAPHLHALCVAENTVSTKLKKLSTLLENSTFESSGSWFYYRGKVLLAHRLMQDVKRELIPVLHDLAEIDAYYSIATLFKEHQNKETLFCFIDCSESETPHIVLDNFWLPLVADNQIILNSVDWGNNKPTKIVLTGPNGCGKSTIMKSISWSIILGQAWGIAPAQRASLSLFKGVRTCLNPQEDLEKKLSSFMAEKEQAKTVLQYLETHSKYGNIFIAFDEPFKGTVESEAERYCYNLGLQLADMPGCLVMIATHLRKPIQLAQEKTGIFDNYQVELNEFNDTFERTFKLIHGPAEWWFDNAQKRSKFVDQLSVS